MKCFYPLVVIFLLLNSCGSPTLSAELNCTVELPDGLEKVQDVHQQFAVTIPKHWNTNLYYDAAVSSIYTADTTKQLTETYLLDVTMISTDKSESSLLSNFRNQLLEKELIEIASFETNILKRNAYYSRAVGKKQGHLYEVMNIFIFLKNNKQIHVKAEVYGDSMRNERLCEALQLIENTEIYHDK